MKTTIEELEALIQKPSEDEHLEFKNWESREDDSQVGRYCVALANEGGGRLVIGVTDKRPRRIVGTQAYLDTGKIAFKLLQQLKFRVDVQELEHPQGRVLIFHIPSRPTGDAYDYKGEFLMRSGESLVPMVSSRLREILTEGAPHWLSCDAKRGCSGADVIALLNTQIYFDLLEIAYPSRSESVIEKFEAESLIRKSGQGWAITNLGAILFAKDLEDFGLLRRKGARVVVYDGVGKIETHLDRTLNGGYVVEFEALVQLILDQTQENEIIGQALRRPIKMFPKITIRELVANSLIHQEFSENGGSVIIEIYDDRMEISNPGSPVIKTERFIDGYKSRNDTLADLMRRLHICEEKGSGVDKVVNACEDFQLPAPDFRIGQGRTIVVLFSHKEFADMDRGDRLRACYQHCCLRYVMNKRMTNQSLRERFQLPEKRMETVSRIIREAVEAESIQIADPDATSTRYRSYIPYWA